MAERVEELPVNFLETLNATNQERVSAIIDNLCDCFTDNAFPGKSMVVVGENADYLFLVHVRLLARTFQI